MQLKATLTAFEEGYSTLVSDQLEFLADELHPALCWVPSLFLLSAAGFFTLLYLIVKLFIPRRFHP